MAYVLKEKNFSNYSVCLSLDRDGVYYIMMCRKDADDVDYNVTSLEETTSKKSAYATYRYFEKLMKILAKEALA